MEQIVSVEETQIKDKKCILLRIKGGKQFVLQCEVIVVRSVCVFPNSRLGSQKFLGLNSGICSLIRS